MNKRLSSAILSFIGTICVFVASANAEPAFLFPDEMGPGIATWMFFIEPALAIYLIVKTWKVRAHFLSKRVDRLNISVLFLDKVVKTILSAFFLALLWSLISLFICSVILFPGSLVLDEFLPVDKVFAAPVTSIGLSLVLGGASTWLTHQFLFSSTSDVRDSPFLLLLYFGLLLFLTCSFEVILLSLHKVYRTWSFGILGEIGIAAVIIIINIATMVITYRFIKWINASLSLREKAMITSPLE